MADDANERLSPRDSLEFALGELHAVSKANAEEVLRLRRSQGTLPQRIASALQPQLAAINSTLTEHDKRLLALEQGKWTLVGGGLVIVTVGGYLVNTYIIPLLTVGIARP